MSQNQQSQNKSCVGCKFLYGKGHGYSNYTWEETSVRCALDKNPQLLNDAAVEGYDWKKSSPEEDNFPRTMHGRCESYAPGGVYPVMDVDHEDGPASFTDDEEVIAAICKHSGHGRNGGYGK